MLTLVVPGLIWPRQALADLSGDLPLPALSYLIGRGGLHHGPGTDATAMLAGELGLAAPLPAAALRRLAFGNAPDDGEWLCLDPVRLRFEERSLVLDDPRALGLEASEAEALTLALAPTFAALGELSLLAPQVWNLRLSAPAPEFAELGQSVGRAVAPLPVRADYAPWRQALNDAQMLLHAHPVNQAREAAGKPQVNSLWPWGGGRLPVPTSCRLDRVWSADPVIQGMAQVQGIGSTLLPDAYAPGTGRSTLASFDRLAGPSRLGDALAWRDALMQLESAWLAPAVAAMRRGQLDVLRLLAPGEHNSVALSVSRSDLWKFWRKPRPLADAFAAGNPA